MSSRQFDKDPIYGTNNDVNNNCVLFYVPYNDQDYMIINLFERLVSFCSIDDVLVSRF